MSVCACGQLMEVGDGWCQRCWARWSTWFMRAGGRWIVLNGRPQAQCQSNCTGDRGLPCKDCRSQHMLQELVDEAERFTT